MSADLEALSREIAATSDAVRLAIAALKANPPHEQSPLPWYGCQFTGVLRDGDSNEQADSLTVNDSLHIAAAVNAAPILAAEVDRLTAQLEAARVAVEDLPEFHGFACRSGDYGGKCDCSAKDAIDELRRVLGLEVSP